MTIRQQIVNQGRAEANAANAEEFIRLCWFILKHRGKFSDACRAVESGKLEKVKGLTTRLINILNATADAHQISRATLQQKAAVGAIGIASSPLQDYNTISAAMLGSLASNGIFDSMLPDMVPVPLGGAVTAAVNVTATGYSINEGQAKPISKLSLTGAQITPVKVLSPVVFTKELAQFSFAQAGAFIESELRKVIVTNTDDNFLDNVTAGVVPAQSFGTSAANAWDDVEYLLRITAPKANSKPYLITTPAICRTLATKTNSGQKAFPALNWNGGSIAGVPVLTSDAVSLGFLICIDASRIAGNVGEIFLEQFQEITAQLDDAADSPPTGSTNLQSLWQLNQIGLLAERYLIALKLASNAVTIINQPNSYVVGSGSP